MPFIDCKFSKQLTPEACDGVKRGLGELVGVLGKSENYLMVGVEDCYTLYFGGKRLENGAYLSVSVFGAIDPAQSEAFTAGACELLENELGIAPKNVYITYRGVENWGWNGFNF